jgi:hypothetical protein
VVQSWATGWMIEGSSPGRGWQLFSSPQRPDRAPGPTQPPIQWIPWSLSVRVKRSRCEADHSPPSSAEVKIAWSNTSTPYIVMAWCSVKAQEQLYIYLMPRNYTIKVCLGGGGEVSLHASHSCIILGMAPRTAQYSETNIKPE